jgi:L-aminopeptidase/D-esterase-like protein
MSLCAGICLCPAAIALAAAGLALAAEGPGLAGEKKPRPRARDLGVVFEGTPGTMNAITDVRGVEVGHTTLIAGGGKLRVGTGPVRTGVTAILPRGKTVNDPVFGAWFSLNGNGEMTGTHWLDESGFLDGPILVTNTQSVGTVRDAAIAWQIARGRKPVTTSYDAGFWSLPVVAETWDGWLNDVNGFHVREKHVFTALDGAGGGAVPEGNVGGGTGMVCYEFKGGIGTASRKLDAKAGGFTVGVLVQCNCGRRNQLRISGVPVGLEIPVEDSKLATRGGPSGGDVGSIIIVVATDAPLLPHQLKRLARRVTMGLARTGSVSGNGSGDLFIAFSTANAGAAKPSGTAPLTILANEDMNPLFTATVQATEEAIVNALVAAETMTGIDGHKAEALPHDKLKEALKKYNRLAEPEP